ncbi:MAG: hypothetical protein RLZZ09_3292 [Pseudomonadota bacterium]|jgi:hypothetical protein
MWFTTPTGFYSAEMNKADAMKDQVSIRARSIAELDQLRQQWMPDLGAQNLEPLNPFPAVARIPSDAFAEGLQRLGMDSGMSETEESAVPEGSVRSMSYLHEKLSKTLARLAETDYVDISQYIHPRMAWRLAQTIKKFRCLYHAWPTRIAMPETSFDLLLLDIGEAWHQTLLDKLIFAFDADDIQARNEAGDQVEFDPVYVGTVDHREAYSWMFGKGDKDLGITRTA